MFRKNSLKRSFKLLAVLGILALTASVAFAQDRPWTTQGARGDYSERPMPAQISGAKLDTPAGMQVENLADLRVNPELRGQSGRVQVVVRLAGSSAADSSALQATLSQQGAFVSAARSADSRAKVLGSTQVVMNAVMLEVDASALSALAQNPDVVSINPVRNYELDLSETVPYIGATAVQAAGYDGTGVRVAVIDSGIDYTHIAFDGSGDPNDWLNNDPTIIEPGTFPTARVVGGYDFVGSVWPNGPEMPDPDPIDDGPGGGHGTHVADIIGGAMGVAPGVDLYALKVCSSVSSSCSGVALMNAMDFAVDPNGDGNPDDAVDIINMSLGSSYGDPRWDDLAFAVNQASALGVLTVASAGNSADKPYANGTPSSASTALAVAQTAVPSETQAMMEIVSPEASAGLYAAVFQTFAVPVTSRIEAPVIYGDLDGDNRNGCAPFSNDLSGYIVLIDRGACNFSLKISNVSVAGGEVGIIGLIAPGDPFNGSDGGDRPIDIPGFMISQADSNTLKSAVAGGGAVVSFDPANGISLVQHLVGSSSRGPAVGTNEAGPDIGAPGASVSALYGTGTGTEAFGGTSGAAPMVSGSAALLMDAYPDRTWSEIKAVLMNTGETDMMNAPEFFGGYQAAISRIGGGEVRVNDALNSTVAAWDRNALDATLSFGFHDVTGNQTMVKRITVRNYGNQPVTLRSNVVYRFDEDDSGVVRLSVPSWFTVPGNGSVNIPVHMHIRPRPNQPLHDWAMNSGSNGANPDALTFNEYDGYIYFEGVGGSTVNIHMPWHVLPRGAGDVQSGVRQNGLNWVRNTGVAASYIDTYSLLGTSDEQPGSPALGGNEAPADLRYVGVQTYPVPAGYCGADPSFVMAFAVNTWDRYSHASNIWIEADLDVDGDGAADYAVFNFDASGGFSSVPSDGRSLTWVYDLNSGAADAWFYTGHETNSGNFVLTFCGDQIGLNASDFFTTSMGVNVFAVDWYYGVGEDAITDMNVVPLGERYYTIFGNGDAGYTELPARSGALPFGVIDFGDQMNATENGLLWLYGPGAPANNEARAWIIN